MYFNTTSMIVSQATASASFTTDVPAINFGYMGFQFIWTSMTSANGTIKLQGSLDGTNFNDYTSSTVTLGTGSSNQIYDFNQPTNANFIRVVYTAGSNTAGKMSVIVTKKGHV